MRDWLQGVRNRPTAQELLQGPVGEAGRRAFDPVGSLPDAQGLQAAWPPLAQRTFGLITAALVLAGLYLGRELLVPLALAVLLSFVIDPLVTWLKRRGLPRVVAVLAVVSILLALLAGLGLFMAGQAKGLAAELPTYQSNIQRKLRTLRAELRAPGAFDGALKVFDTVETEIEATRTDLATRTATPKEAAAESRAPTRVRIVESVTPWQRLSASLETVTAPLLTAGLVLLFVILILLDRHDLRDRLLRLWGGDLHRTTDALSEAAERVGRYLTMQLAVNASYGVPMALGLWWIGVPGALMWGVIAAVMRFVPYIGPWIAAILPLTLAFAVDPGWQMVGWTLGLIVLLELVSNNVVEPLAYGSSTGLSALSLVLAATFWTALWGPIGLILSTPLTVCLLVLGRHLPQLAFLDVLLGAAPALDEPTRLYQRLLAGDVAEAVEMAADAVQRDGADAFYDQTAIPMLRLATNAHGSSASAEQRHRVGAGARAILDELRSDQAAANTEAAREANAAFPARWHGSERPHVVCTGGRWEVDQIAAGMACDALLGWGQRAAQLATPLATADDVAALELRGARWLLVSYFSPSPEAHVRYLLRRLRRRWPELKVVLALWNAPALVAQPGIAATLGVDFVVGSIEQLHQKLDTVLANRGDVSAEWAPAPIPEGDATRVAALSSSGALDPALRGSFDSLARRVADIFNVPWSMVNFLGATHQVAQGAAGFTAADLLLEDSGPGFERAQTVCGHTVAQAATLVVQDVLHDPRFAGNPVLSAGGFRFYAGAPLLDADGNALGTLCVLDRAPRSFTEREKRLLEALADDAMDQLRRQRSAASSPGPTAAPAAALATAQGPSTPAATAAGAAPSHPAAWPSVAPQGT